MCVCMCIRMYGFLYVDINIHHEYIMYSIQDCYLYTFICCIHLHLSVCTYIHIYIYTYIHIYIYTYIHIYIYTYIHIYTYIIIYTYMHVNIHSYLCVYRHCMHQLEVATTPKHPQSFALGVQRTAPTAHRGCLSSPHHLRVSIATIQQIHGLCIHIIYIYIYMEWNIMEYYGMYIYI